MAVVKETTAFGELPNVEGNGCGALTDCNLRSWLKMERFMVRFVLMRRDEKRYYALPVRHGPSHAFVTRRLADVRYFLQKSTVVRGSRVETAFVKILWLC